MEEFEPTFPMFVPLLKDKTGVVFLRLKNPPNIYLPIFTDRDSAVTFLEGSGLSDSWLAELPTPGAVITLLQDHPRRHGEPFKGFLIIDPIGLELSGLSLHLVDAFIDLLRRGS
jgi:hypothetical protein